MFAAVNTSKLIRLRHSKLGSLEEQHFRAFIGIWSRLVFTLLTDLSLRVKNLLQVNSPMPSSVSVGLASFFSAFASSVSPGALWRSSLDWKPFKEHPAVVCFSWKNRQTLGLIYMLSTELSTSVIPFSFNTPAKKFPMLQIMKTRHCYDIIKSAIGL